MNRIRAILLIAVFTLSSCGRPPELPGVLETAEPKRVNIIGYEGNAKEPFITPDGQFLLFVDGNTATNQSNILYAHRKDPFTWMFIGPFPGASSDTYDGSPSMDYATNMYFISLRKYSESLNSLFMGSLSETGLTNIRPITDLLSKKVGRMCLEAEISQNGQTLYYSKSSFYKNAGPQSSNITYAVNRGGTFKEASDTLNIFSKVNTTALEYGAALTNDERKLYFTRWDTRLEFTGPKIFRAERTTINDPFVNITKLDGLGDFVESPAVSSEEHLLYFHRRDTDDEDNESFSIYAVPLP